MGSGAKPRPPNDLVHFIGLRCALVATCYPKIHLFNKSFYDCFCIITSELISWHCNFYSINIFKCNARIAVIYDMSISILRVHHTDYSYEASVQMCRDPGKNLKFDVFFLFKGV